MSASKKQKIKTMYKKVATERSIMGGEMSGIPPVYSEMDVGVLDPEQFLKEMPKARAKYALGKDVKNNNPDDFFVVPAYKTSIIKEYDKLPKNFKRKAMLMYSEGCSDAEVMAVFGIALKSWNEWIVDHPEFAEFVEIGNKRGQAWWERMARKFVTQPQSKFNASLWFMTMKNVYGYKDERKIENTNTNLHGFVLLPPESVENIAALPSATRNVIDLP